MHHGDAAGTSTRHVAPKPRHTAIEWQWKEVGGKGCIYSPEVVHHAIQPGFEEWTPYAVVLVELDERRGKPTADEALRIIANLVPPDGSKPEAEAKVAIGKHVRVVFQDLTPVFALPQFTLTDEPPVGRVSSIPGQAALSRSRGEGAARGCSSKSPCIT